jgi:hypothetical protein
MTLLWLAAMLPWLFWDQGPETAAQLKDAGITRIAVPAPLEAAWKEKAGFTVRVADRGTAVELAVPGVQYLVDEASATRAPWIDANGWRILREPESLFYYKAPGMGAGLSAAEAHMHGGDAIVQTDAAGLKPLGEMLTFLARLKTAEMRAVANVGFIDDGSAEAGEAMKMMMRRNLLIQVAREEDARLDLNVRFGSEKYPVEAATDPSEFAQKIRYELTDDRRALRIYGSDVVLGRLNGDGHRLRIHLLNYTAASRPVNGIRVRVKGEYSKHEAQAAGVESASVLDFESGDGFTEFTLPELISYAVIDLSSSRNSSPTAARSLSVAVR